MATGELDIDKIQRELAILMTNSVELQSKMYDIFVSSTPMDVEVRVWTGENTFETIMVPNRAKGNIPAQFGGETPEGTVEASYGTIYFNENNGKLYIKTTLTGTDGWQELVTQTALDYHNELDANAHENTLAKVNGDESIEFNVADIDINSNLASEESLAVNKKSLFKLLGGLENLNTEDKTSVVNALNEAMEMAHCDGPSVITADPVSCIDGTSNKSKLLSLEPTQRGTYRIRVLSPFVVVDCKGAKHSVPALSIETNEFDVTIKANRNTVKYSIFVSFELEDIKDGNPSLVALPGDYYTSVHRPYLMQENDTWLDLGNTPYAVKVNTRDPQTKQLVLKEKNYVFLGTAEEVTVNE